MSAFDAALRAPNNSKALAGNLGGQGRTQEVLSPDWAIEAAAEVVHGVSQLPGRGIITLRDGLNGIDATTRTLATDGDDAAGNHVASEGGV